MTFERGHFGFFIAFIIIGAILGSAAGTFLAGIVPVLSPLNKNLTGPIGFNLEVLSLYIKISPAAIIGLITGITIFKRI
jgi:hypothetical protein